MTKNEIRKLYREKRNALKHNEINRLQDLLLISFQQLSLPFIGVLHRYMPAIGKNEPDPSLIAEWMEFRNPGMLQLVPRVNKQTNELQHLLYSESTAFLLNEWGIPEPENSQEYDPGEIDMVIIPLLGFDESGQRVGYGKGYYDRFLCNCRPDCIKVGLSFFQAVQRIEDTNTFDIAMDYCITPERVYEF